MRQSNATQSKEGEGRRGGATAWPQRKRCWFVHMFALSLVMVRFVLILQRDLEINGTSKQMFILDWMDFYMLLGGKAAHRINNVEPISYVLGIYTLNPDPSSSDL